MSRVTRDELITALHTAIQVLRAFPSDEFEIPDVQPTRGLLPDGAALFTHAPSNLGDGATVPLAPGRGKGQPQPPRKFYTVAPKLRLDRVDWAGVPHAGQRAIEFLHEHGTPQTSHDIIRHLQIARSTWANAASILLKRKILVTVPVRQRTSASRLAT